MRIKMYQVDAFASKVFDGNPAAICLLDRWLDDDVMQSIATRNNLPETAFIVLQNGDYLLRWFTPTMEVDLCGHATLATAYVVFHELQPQADQVTFHTLSGPLIVKRFGHEMQMDFPALSFSRVDVPPILRQGLGVNPVEVYQSTDYMVVVDSVETLKSIKPNHDLLAQLDLRGVAVAAQGRRDGQQDGQQDGMDFLSRFFAPKLKIYEDSITGSAHCAWVPYWAQKLNKTSLRAKQLTDRNIQLRCVLQQNRVLLFGEAAPYSEGFITVPA